jgi:hypothetical protein
MIAGMEGGCSCAAVRYRLTSAPLFVHCCHCLNCQRIFRCPSCQTAVYSFYGRPGVGFVRAGTLDDPRQIAPDVHIFTRSKVDWLVLPESVPAFDVYYNTSEMWPAASLERARGVRPRQGCS